MVSAAPGGISRTYATDRAAHALRLLIGLPCSSSSRLRYLCAPGSTAPDADRKSTRLNSSHSQISYAVFCLKKKKLTCTPITDCGCKREHRASLAQWNT